MRGTAVDANQRPDVAAIAAWGIIAGHTFIQFCIFRSAGSIVHRHRHIIHCDNSNGHRCNGNISIGVHQLVNKYIRTIIIGIWGIGIGAIGIHDNSAMSGSAISARQAPPVPSVAAGGIVGRYIAADRRIFGRNAHIIDCYGGIVNRINIDGYRCCGTITVHIA